MPCQSHSLLNATRGGGVPLPMPPWCCHNNIFALLKNFRAVILEFPACSSHENAISRNVVKLPSVCPVLAVAFQVWFVMNSSSLCPCEGTVSQTRGVRSAVMNQPCFNHHRHPTPSTLTPKPKHTLASICMHALCAASFKTPTASSVCGKCKPFPGFPSLCLLPRCKHTRMDDSQLLQ